MKISKGKMPGRELPLISIGSEERLQERKIFSLLAEGRIKESELVRRVLGEVNINNEIESRKYSERASVFYAILWYCGKKGKIVYCEPWYKPPNFVLKIFEVPLRFIPKIKMFRRPCAYFSGKITQIRAFGYYELARK